MVHPVQSVIESLYAAGRCPRLHVNATHESVVCPDFIREQWKERLIIDLDASYPLDLTFDDGGLAADLSFGGYVTRCEFPWEAIYIVADRATGRGIVLDRHMPESVRSMFQKARAAEVAKAAKGPELRPVGEDDGAAETATEAEAEVAAEERPPEDPAAAAAVAEAASEAPAADEGAGRGTPGTDEKQVQRRRAAFRVIDGGG
ncbi:MAG: hypothetical protein H6710_09940 [Myxococcales bacterium]|nr:hypothetical protein [Myxococcales bacterium]